MNSSQPDWKQLSGSHSKAAVECLRRKWESLDSFAIDVDELCAKSTCLPAESARLLEKLATDGFLTTSDRFRCLYCKQTLSEDEATESECAHCEARFTEESPGLEQYKVYSRISPGTRDVRWVVTIHGMNTQGAWQEEYTWRLAKLYGYSVPVAIYKYGNIKISPFIPFRRQYYLRRLITNLKRYSADTHESGFGNRPDVIAHSFGTWLLYRALKADTEIKVGRVILTGSIVPPDFDWSGLITAGRVEAVLCHHAGRDIVVRMAQYGISNSGPSGYRGFNDRETVIHKYEPTFAHSDFFSPENLPTVMETIWGKFLTFPNSALPELKDRAATSGIRPWRPSPWRYLTQLLKHIVFILLLLLSGFLALSTVRGLGGTWRWLWRGTTQ